MRKTSLSILENWYNQILLLSEAYPLSQAKYYSSLEKKVNEELVQPIWDRIVQLGDFTSKRKERVYFKFEPPSTQAGHSLQDAVSIYGPRFLTKLYGLLYVGAILDNSADSNYEEYSEAYKTNTDLFDRKLERVHFDILDELTNGDIIQELNSYNLFDTIEIVDPTQGTTLYKGREYKLGKFVTKLKNTVFKNSEYANKLEKLYQEFTTKKSNQPKLSRSYLIVISRHAYDVAGMSSGRGWISCMTLPGDSKKPEGGQNVRYVACDVREGTMVAYLVLPDDTNIKNPVGRVLIKPYYHGVHNILVYRPEKKAYGNVPSTFLPAVNSIFNKVNSSKSLPSGRYKLPASLYPDAGSDSLQFFTVNSEFNFKEVEEQVKLIKREFNAAVTALTTLMQAIDTVDFMNEFIYELIRSHKRIYHKVLRDLASPAGPSPTLLINIGHGGIEHFTALVAFADYIQTNKIETRTNYTGEEKNNFITTFYNLLNESQNVVNREVSLFKDTSQLLKSVESQLDKITVGNVTAVNLLKGVFKNNTTGKKINLTDLITVLNKFEIAISSKNESLSNTLRYFRTETEGSKLESRSAYILDIVAAQCITELEAMLVKQANVRVEESYYSVLTKIYADYLKSPQDKDTIFFNIDDVVNDINTFVNKAAQSISAFIIQVRKANRLPQYEAIVDQLRDVYKNVIKLQDILNSKSSPPSDILKIAADRFNSNHSTLGAIFADINTFEGRLNKLNTTLTTASKPNTSDEVLGKKFTEVYTISEELIALSKYLLQKLQF